MSGTNQLAAIALAACALPAAGCGERSPQKQTTGQTPRTTTARSAAPVTPTGTRITLAGSDFGKILFDGRGQAIYLFAKEKTSRPECYGDCAAAWPPVYTKGTPRAGSGIRARLLGTTKRRDGRLQVTYGGHPLYFYANEGRREVRCHNVFLNGGLWLVVRADGRPVG